MNIGLVPVPVAAGLHTAPLRASSASPLHTAPPAHITRRPKGSLSTPPANLGAAFGPVGRRLSPAPPRSRRASSLAPQPPAASLPAVHGPARGAPTPVDVAAQQKPDMPVSQQAAFARLQQRAPFIWPAAVNKPLPLDELWVHPHQKTLLPSHMSQMWLGDDAQALYDAIHLQRINISHRCAVLGIDTVMLAHRLQRLGCAWVVFNHLFGQDAMAGAITQGGSGPNPMGQIFLYCQTFVRLITQPKEPCKKAQLSIHRVVEIASIQNVLASWHDMLFSQRHVVGLLPRALRTYDQFVLSALLGRLLSEFSQESLIDHGGRLAHLVAELANLFDYPLDKENLYLDLATPAQSTPLSG